MNVEASSPEVTAFELVQNYANRFGYSDVCPFEIIKRISSKTLVVRSMTAVLDDAFKPNFIAGGFSAICTNNNKQEWVITSNPDGQVLRIRLQKNGTWKDANGHQYGLNSKPVKHYDYNF